MVLPLPSIRGPISRWLSVRHVFAPQAMSSASESCFFVLLFLVVSVVDFMLNFLQVEPVLGVVLRGFLSATRRDAAPGVEPGAAPRTHVVTSESASPRSTRQRCATERWRPLRAPIEV